MQAYKELYNTIISNMDHSEFYEFSDNNLKPGYICYAPVWYEKVNKWYLTNANYNPIDEEKSTWYAKILKSLRIPQPDSYVMKYFQIEKDEHLFTTTGKVRPVILINKSSEDWLQRSKSTCNWLVLPIFSYKERHNQLYRINDQRLKNPNSFYMPAAYDKHIGLNNESAARYQTMQSINEQFLEPIKLLDSNKNMQRPIKISDIALKILTYHFVANNLQLDKFVADIVQNQEEMNQGTFYHLFKEEVNEYIDNNPPGQV